MADGGAMGRMRKEIGRWIEVDEQGDSTGRKAWAITEFKAI